MRRKGLWLSVLATALIAGSASAATIYGGNGYNFFQYNNDPGLSNPTWDYSQVQLLGNTQRHSLHYQEGTTADFPVGAPFVNADGVYTHGEAPLPGGDSRDALLDQRYDVEEFFWAYDASTQDLHIGIVTGFNSAGVPTNGHYAGDLFVAFGGTPINIPSDIEYNYAIGTSSDRNGSEWENNGSSNWVTSPNANPFDFEADPYRYGSGGNIANVAQVSWTENVPNNVHNFLAVRIDLTGSSYLADLLSTTNGGFTAHWTMGCGNDAAHYTLTSAPPQDNLVPVPAAAPLGLLGMGLLALVRRVRRRPEC